MGFAFAEPWADGETSFLLTGSAFAGIFTETKSLGSPPSYPAALPVLQEEDPGVFLPCSQGL